MNPAYFLAVYFVKGRPHRSEALPSTSRTHDRCPAYWPFCPVLEVNPDFSIAVRFRIVDGADRKPDNEYNNNYQVENGPDFVDPTNERSPLHTQHSLGKNNSQER